VEWRESNGLKWLEAELPHGARAAFSTRLGGVSEGDFESLNIGVLTDDARVSVVDNRRRLDGALGLDPASVVIGRQVHGGEIARHDGPQDPAFWSEPGPEPPHVDGHVVAEPGLAALVFVADCLPIALAAPGGAAMLHGGWRGLAAGIAGRGVDELGDPARTAAAIGPGIGPCCYEVGDEVLAAFAPLGSGLAEGRMLDLPAVARRLLERAGVERIEDAGLCTRCNQDLFFSHRGSGGRTGRQAGVAWIEAG
jgi:YfiH family protein